MVELFDPESRAAVVLAQAVAKKTGSSEIRHEHLLVAMLAEPRGMAARLLDLVEADIEGLSLRLREKLGPVNPVSPRPRLSKEVKKAIRSARRQALASPGIITPGHLLVALTRPLSGWARQPLASAGVSSRALEAAYRSGASEPTTGIDPSLLAWVWHYLPETAGHVNTGDRAQAANDLASAIDSFTQALHAAAAEDLPSGAIGDIYPRLVQANLLAGKLDTALEWLDEADRFLANYDFDWDQFADLPATEEVRDLMAHVEAGLAIHMQDLRLQFMKDRAHIEMGRDRFDRVESVARQLIDVADELGHDAGMAAGRHLLGTALAHRGGSDEEAERNLLASIEPARMIDPVDHASRVYSIAVFELLRGDDERAFLRAEEAEALYMDLGLQRSVKVARLAKAEAGVAAGRRMPPGILEEAERMDSTGAAQILGWALRLQAIGLRESDPGDALEIIDRAIASCRAHGHRLLLGRCLLEKGRLLAAIARVDDAREALEEASNIFEQLQVRFAADARRDLEALSG